MTTARIKFLIGAALVGAALTVGTGAQAYWGDRWGDPWYDRDWEGGPWSEPGYPYSGYGRSHYRTYERQDRMRDHRSAMQSVARMLSGQRSFDRARAIGLARQIEASAGENLVRQFEPGVWRRSPLSRARIDDFEAFRANAEALKQAAGALADELEKRPSAQDIRAGRAWSPDWGMGGGYDRWRNEGEVVTKQVFDAYTNLRATCHGCHANFRSAWR